MSGVRGGIASLVISVDAQIQAHQFVEGGIIVPKHAAEVAGVVERVILINDAVKVYVAVNCGCNLRELGNDIEDILQGVLVVVGLGHTVGVGLGEFGLSLAGVEANAHLGHGVHVFWEVLEEGNDVSRKLRTLVKLGRQGVDLLLSRDLGRKEQPEKTLKKGFAIAFPSGERWEDLLALGNGQATEPDALLGIKVGSLPKHAFDTASTANGLVNGNLSDSEEEEKLEVRS